MKEYRCFKCGEPIRFSYEWKDEQTGKAIPLSMRKDRRHECYMTEHNFISKLLDWDYAAQLEGKDTTDGRSKDTNEY
jgi:hypothetical protein